jgi:hypothetical protein
MRTLAPITDAKFMAAARPLLPRIEAAAARLATLTNVNRAVHAATYNRLIAEAALKANAGGAVA